MGAEGSVGPAGVTLQIAIAGRGRGLCATLRGLNHALRRRRAPRLLGCGFRSSGPLWRAERATDREDGPCEITHDELSLHANDAVAPALELAGATLVRCYAPGVVAAVDFNDQAD